MIYTQKQLGYKKSVQNGQCEKFVESKGWPRNGWWWYRLMVKFLIIFRRILCWSLVKLGWDNTNWPELLLLKFYCWPIPSQPFLGRPFDFKMFLTLAILNRATLFLQPGCFWVYIVYRKNFNLCNPWDISKLSVKCTYV